MILPPKSGDGRTLLTPDEESDLIPNLSTREELNEWERLNILEAYTWALSRRNLNRLDPLAEAYVRGLHLRMFDQTWKWAGRYRSTEKNIGIASYRIRDALPALLGDVRYWMQHSTFSPDEIAVRLHHKMVWIHPFSNGNGRHARLLADVLTRVQGQPLFSWGSTSFLNPGNFRQQYISALQSADVGDIAPLLKFARS